MLSLRERVERKLLGLPITNKLREEQVTSGPRSSGQDAYCRCSRWACEIFSNLRRRFAGLAYYPKKTAADRSGREHRISEFVSLAAAAVQSSLVAGKIVHVTTSFPEWVEPMAATLTQERFTGPGWTFERKLDGIRLLRSSTGRTSVFSRVTGCCKTLYPSLVESIASLPSRGRTSRR